jgi:hypothetical protein
MFSHKQRRTLVVIHKLLRKENFYWKVGYYALILAGTVHVGFLLMFLWLKLYVLAVVNVVSISIYWYAVFGIGLRTLQRRDDGLIGWLVYIELLGHNVIATYYLGVGAGFQYYIYLLAVIPFFISTYSMPVYLLRVLVALGSALFLDMSGFFMHARVPVGYNTISWMYQMNLFTAAGALAFLTYLYLRKERIHHQTLLEKEDMP